MSSLGALTTTFTAPASCATMGGITISESAKDMIWWGEGPLSAPECLPTSYRPAVSNYYSPGICPSGYTPGCTARVSVATLTETIYTCCPRGVMNFQYSCVTQGGWEWQKTLGCTYDHPRSLPLTLSGIPYIDMLGNTRKTSTTQVGLGIGAYGVVVKFQSTDFVSTTSASSQTSSTSGSTAATTKPTDSAAGADTTSGVSTANAGLGTGAIVGIAVGVVALVLALAGFGIFAWRRKRKAKNINLGYHGAPPPVSDGPIPPSYGKAQELYTNGRHQIHEMPHHTDRAELG